MHDFVSTKWCYDKHSLSSIKLMADDEQLRALVVDGAFPEALALCRRLLRADASAQTGAQVAQLLLERLRGGGDAADDADALLRLLGNYVAPTRELAAEALSLLFFCEHRVLLIHHLSKARTAAIR